MTDRNLKMTIWVIVSAFFMTGVTALLFHADQPIIISLIAPILIFISGIWGGWYITISYHGND